MLTSVNVLEFTLLLLIVGFAAGFSSGSFPTSAVACDEDSSDGSKDKETDQAYHCLRGNMDYQLLTQQYSS